MTRTRAINIRVSVEEYNFVKEMGGSFSKIWDIGFEKWSLEYPEFISKKLQEYKNLYTQCIYKMQNCIDNVYTKNKDLDKLYHEYLEHGRNIQHPSSHDKSWLRARLTKLNNGTNLEKFIEYCQKRYLDEKQKKLEVDE